MNKYVVNSEKRKKLGEYIKKIREQKKLGMNQLSIKISVTNSLISKLENGLTQKISPFLLKEIAKGLRVDYKELYKIVGYLEEDDCLPEGNLDLECNFKKIPLYDSISAGVGLEDLENEDIDFITVPDIKQFSGDVVAIKVSGDSMEYTIENRSIVFIRKDVEVPNKKVGAFIHNNKALLKRYICLDEHCFLRSDNRDYPDIEIKKNDEFVVVGRFIGQLNEEE
ncbi:MULTISPECIES: helix-turn-helix domain-containing protein [Psychrilyobacter]|uniref:Helix-turn-helix domain-containing protein n=1 Tax=Psychrilyobacter piezotolerans TaxID=2293438 RepID=A0ABX9KJ83_9FUSO|nr:MULTISPECIES: XRE family transcriptional regulator [Psychrilyobacter]MCS5421878.1 XRE family transcriptional regulator [Psychrilyobacter sp. S5]NDI76967.1 LexA family transcriptional regulator [Psychrilyobacter piezotolerans]RDE64585.1 LexA family transcriptional regulator [Psychrilyobacter sp. S5]REI42397.1 helix-turn-helix domain-containing protein [Psychrilyobacter piezotolerans]